MTCEEITPTPNATITFPSGARIVVEYLPRGPATSAPQTSTLGGWASFQSLATDEKIELPGAVDDAETTPEPRFFVLYGQPVDKLLLLGGYFAYALSDSANVGSTTRLNRSPQTEEYWSTTLLPRKAGLVVIYENGVMFIEEDLTPRWHVQKLINDFFVGCDGDELIFTTDHAEEWRLSTSTGLKCLRANQGTEP